MGHDCPMGVLSNMLKIYLAGAIRDDHPEDRDWREYIIDKVESKYALDVRILNPLGNKTFNPANREWKMGGIRAAAKDIVQQDLWSVRQADIIIANFTSLSQGYPSIGTVMEVGAASGIGGKLIYSILDSTGGHLDKFTNANPGVFKIHPFLEQVSASVFGSVDELWAFLSTHLGMLTGSNPRFAGVIVGGEVPTRGR
jgi:nucleoside 2-deoxyribosyltransferase